MLSDKIGLAGVGWGAVVALKSLQAYFSIEVLSSDIDVTSLLKENDSQVDTFDDFTVPVVVCAGYKPIIPTSLLNKYEVINIHYSLLPKYRGYHSTAWAIMNGEKKLGLSIHLMNAYVDDGPIIYQYALENDQRQTMTFYMEHMNAHIKEHLGGIIKQYLMGEITPSIQDKKQASWVGKRGKKHNRIDFYQSNEYIRRQFRVLNPPYPLPFFSTNKDEYTVGKVEFHTSTIMTDCSRILNIDNEGVWVKTADGYVILKQIFNSKNQEVDYRVFKFGQYLNRQ